MPLKTLIIDDERLARTELKRMLADFSVLDIAGEAANASEAKKMIETMRPDLIFLDIQMPGRSGFDLLNDLEYVPKVIFTTAYDEFALKAFQVNALDYLMKPIDPERLKQAIAKLELSPTSTSEVSEDTPKQTHILGAEDRFFIKDGEKCWFVQLADVRFFESTGNYTKVYFEQNKPLILKSLNALEERLDDYVFFRCSRKHIVNINWIKTIEPYFNGGLILLLKSGEKIEVSRRQTARFRDKMSL